ncbi:hypothetical protein SNEBB_008249 [Seison nebaliae]|nr:hypothetical protein SNEBB_008249 [Seison nebaliae]
MNNQNYELLGKEEILQLILNLPKNIKEPVKCETALGRFKFLLNENSEQIQFIDKHLKEYFHLLLENVKNDYLEQRVDGKNEDIIFNQLSNESFNYLRPLIFTRGYKIVQKFFPHDYQSLLMVMDMLESKKVNGGQEMVLIVWLQLLVKMPFDLERFDEKKSSCDEKCTLAERILKISDKSKYEMDIPIIQFLIGQLMARKDVFNKYFQSYLREKILIPLQDKKIQELKRDNKTYDSDSFLQLHRRLYILAGLLKYVERTDLLPYVDEIFDVLKDLSFFIDLESVNIKKDYAKCIHRCALIYLKPKIALWRYNRGTRSLEEQLLKINSKEIQNKNKEIINGDGNGDGNLNYNDDDDDDNEVEISEEVEMIINIMLNGLKNKDTYVRYSFAKGIGRITSRLSLADGEDVIRMLVTPLEVIGTGEDHSTIFISIDQINHFHGILLAVGELARRGFFLISFLAQPLLPALQFCLLFDRRYGTTFEDNKLRDSAAYVCWSLARCIEPKHFAPYIVSIASSLLAATLFDKDISIRRAASAAFQEYVGRQDELPYGIELLQKIDYNSVKCISYCFKKIAPFVMSFDCYSTNLLETVVCQKLYHWDNGIRELSAKFLHRIYRLVHEDYFKIYLKKIISKIHTNDLLAQFGVLVGVGSILRANYDYRDDIPMKKFDKELIEQILSLPLSILKNQSIRFQMNLVRRNLATFYEDLSLSHIWECSTDYHLEFWCDHLSKLEEIVEFEKTKFVSTNKVSNALSCFINEFLYPNKKEKKLKEMFNSWKPFLNYDSNVDSTEILFYTKTLYRLNVDVIIEYDLHHYILEIISINIRSYVSKKRFTSSTDCTSHSILVNCLCKFLYICPFQILTEEFIKKTLDTILVGLNDSTRYEGDYGRYVRESSIFCLRIFLYKLILNNFVKGNKKNLLCPIDSQFFNDIIKIILNRATENIDRTRTIAITTLLSLLDKDLCSNDELFNMMKEYFEIPNDIIFDLKDSIPIIDELRGVFKYKLHRLIDMSVEFMSREIKRKQIEEWKKYIADSENHISAGCSKLYHMEKDYGEHTALYESLKESETTSMNSTYIQDDEIESNLKKLLMNFPKKKICKKLYKYIENRLQINIPCSVYLRLFVKLLRIPTFQLSAIEGIIQTSQHIFLIDELKSLDNRDDYIKLLFEHIQHLYEKALKTNTIENQSLRKKIIIFLDQINQEGIIMNWLMKNEDSIVDRLVNVLMQRPLVPMEQLTVSVIMDYMEIDDDLKNNSFKKLLLSLSSNILERRTGMARKLYEYFLLNEDEYENGAEILKILNEVDWANLQKSDAIIKRKKILKLMLNEE